MLRHFLNELAELPRLMRVGLVVFMIGAVLDLLYHVAPESWSNDLSMFLGREGDVGHIVTLAGMLLILIGVFTARRAHSHRS